MSAGIRNITEVRQNRIRALADIARDYLADYRLRSVCEQHLNVDAANASAQ